MRSARDTREEVVRRALRYWDPIGVIEDRESGTGEADDEYDSYLPGLLGSIEGGNDAWKLARHLSRIRSITIGIGRPSPSEREQELAEKLVKWRESDYKKDPDFRFTRYS